MTTDCENLRELLFEKINKIAELIFGFKQNCDYFEFMRIENALRWNDKSKLKNEKEMELYNLFNETVKIISNLEFRHIYKFMNHDQEKLDSRSLLDLSRHELMGFIEAFIEDLYVKLSEYPPNFISVVFRETWESILEENFSELWYYLTTSKRQWKLLVPLFKLKMKTTPTKIKDWVFELGNGIVLRRFTDKDRRRIKRIPWTFWYGKRVSKDSLNLHEIEYCLEVSAIDEVNALRKAFTALRLFRDGNIWADVAFRIPPSSWSTWFVETRIIGEFRGKPRKDIFPREYQIEPTEISKIKELLRWLNSPVWNDHKFQIAIRRFNMLYSRDFLEDIVIDLAIAYEALFYFGEGGKRGAISRNLANFLGKPKYESKIGDLYSLRGQIVHTNKSEKDLDDKDKKLITFALNVLREAIREIIKISFEHNCSDLQKIVTKDF